MTSTTAATQATDHEVTINLDEFWPSSRVKFDCYAPPEAMCHAVFDCGCESWHEAGVDSGRPWHHHDEWPSSRQDTRHWGRFDPSECNLRDWAENSDEVLRGVLTFGVTGHWDGDCYTFTPVAGGTVTTGH